MFDLSQPLRDDTTSASFVEYWRRIVVFGPSGSGKSTVARRIGRRLHVPVIELDALFHLPNWQPTPDDEFRRKVTAVLDASPDGWVCDGNYTSKVGAIVLPRAEAVVCLHPPFPLAFWRLAKRTIHRAWTKEPLWNTNRESWRLSFMSRDSILLWGITHWRAHFRNIDRALKEIPHQAVVFELRSADDIDTFLRTLGADRRTSTIG